ncbi:hypothetical protein RJZ56_001708, partial [Blastomyces dermatitidis]
MASETLEGFVKKLRTMSGIGLVGLSRSWSEVRVTISSSLVHIETTNFRPSV